MKTMSEKDWAKLAASGRRRIKRMDEIERKAGFAPTSEICVFQQVRTCMMALEVGLKTYDAKPIMEAWAMLEHLVDTLEHTPWARQSIHETAGLN